MNPVYERTGRGRIIDHIDGVIKKNYWTDTLTVALASKEAHDENRARDGAFIMNEKKGEKNNNNNNDEIKTIITQYVLTVLCLIDNRAHWGGRYYDSATWTAKNVYRLSRAVGESLISTHGYAYTKRARFSVEKNRN